MSVVRRFNRTVEKKMRKKVCQESLGESISLGTLGVIWLRVTLIHALTYPPPPHRSPYWPPVARPALLDPAQVTENGELFDFGKTSNLKEDSTAWNS